MAGEKYLKQVDLKKRWERIDRDAGREGAGRFKWKPGRATNSSGDALVAVCVASASDPRCQAAL